MVPRWHRWTALIILCAVSGGGCVAPEAISGSPKDQPAAPPRRSKARFRNTLPSLPATSPAAMPHLTAGASMLRRGQIDAAIIELRRVLQIDSNSVEAHDHLGIAYFKKKNYSAAIKEFQSEIRLEQNSYVGWSRIADVYYAQRDYKRTAESLEKAIEIRDNMPQLYFNLGMVYQQLLQLGKAAQSLERCVELAPQNHYAQYVLGNFLYRMRRLDDAQHALERAIALESDVPEYHHALGLVYLQRQPTRTNAEQALVHLKQALKLGAKEAARVHYDMGVAYQRQEKLEQSVNEWQEAVRLEPHMWAAHYALFDVYSKLGKHPQAHIAMSAFRKYRREEDARLKRSFFQQEVQRNLDNSDAHYQLGMFYLRQGEKALAKRSLENAARLAPRDDRIRRGLMELDRTSSRNKKAMSESR